MSKIKVLEMFGEPITYGGQESVVYNMLSVLDLKNDFDVDLFTPYYADNKDLIELVNKNVGTVYHNDIEFKTGDNRFKLYPIVDNFFKSLDKKYDLVHIHTGSLSTMLCFARAAKINGIKKVIVHAHNAAGKNSIVYKIFRYILSSQLNKYVDYFLGCSRKATNWRWSNAISKKAIVVRSGIEIDKYKFNNEYRTKLQEKYNINNKFVIGNIARFTFEKNHEFMIKIAEELLKYDKDFILCLVGDGPLKENIKAIVSEKHLEDYICLAGNATSAFEYYSLFDIFILPSIYEGLPMTSIEAQASSLPTIISSNVTDECKISDKTYFIDINSASDWAKQILKIKNDMAGNKNYRQDIVVDYKNYDRNYTFKELENIYKS